MDSGCRSWWTPALYSDDRRDVRKPLLTKLPLRINRLFRHLVIAIQTNQ
jgi:hypothetical protein